MNTNKIIKVFNDKANEWLDDLSSISEEKLNIRPAENSWSMAEVYDHVMRVSRRYQIPNLESSMTAGATRKKKKNFTGIAVFNLGVRKNVKMRMEEWPKKIVEDFTPTQRSKADLLDDFRIFIEEVNALKVTLDKSSNQHKQYHPFFGDITTKEWFALIELHLWQHDKQKEKITQMIG